MADKISLISGKFLKKTAESIYPCPTDKRVEITKCTVTNCESKDSFFSLYIVENQETPVHENMVVCDKRVGLKSDEVVDSIIGHIIPKNASIWAQCKNDDDITIFMTGIEIDEP